MSDRPTRDPDRTPGADFVGPLVERISETYGVPRPEVEARTAELLQRFAGARVQTFVPVLVEKELRAAYRRRARETSPAPAGTPAGTPAVPHPRTEPARLVASR
ncbi:three-helix bundle dimerization domain-containing protein [Geodermatophilus sp. SYSU D00758]